MNCRFLMVVLVILPALASCGEYKEIAQPDQTADVAQKEYPIPPEYQEEYQKLTHLVEHYHAGTLPTFDETHARAHSRIGFILFKAGDLGKARENLDRSINMDANIPETHLYLGEVFEAQGQPEGAVREYKKALELKPDLAEAHKYLAESYEKLGYHDQAVEEQNRYDGAAKAGQ
jgi:tetratricopeptide (TPR) repeat protein